MTGAGIGTILDLSVQDNGPIGSGITGFIARREDATLGNNGAALSVRWDGEIRQAVIENNSFQLLGGDGQTGIVVVNGSTTDTSSVFVNANTIVTNAADNAIGGFFEFAGRADLAVTEHRLFDNNNNLLPGLQMNGEASQGFSISMGSGASNLLLENNFLEFNADDGIGFNFPFTNGTPTFVINNNIVNHNTNLFINFAPGERGFDFGPIVGTINFVGSQNNFVNFGLQDFFSVDFPTLPPGSFTGSILVNGRQVP